MAVIPIRGAVFVVTDPATGQTQEINLFNTPAVVFRKRDPQSTHCPTCGTDLDERDRRADGRIKCWSCETHL